jgi:hypothetical protein
MPPSPLPRTSRPYAEVCRAREVRVAPRPSNPGQPSLQVVVTAPIEGRLVLVNPRSGRVIRSVAVPGVPRYVAAVGSGGPVITGCRRLQRAHPPPPVPRQRGTTTPTRRLRRLERLHHQRIRQPHRTRLARQRTPTPPRASSLRLVRSRRRWWLCRHLVTTARNSRHLRPRPAPAPRPPYRSVSRRRPPLPALRRARLRISERSDKLTGRRTSADLRSGATRG